MQDMQEHPSAVRFVDCCYLFSAELSILIRSFASYGAIPEDPHDPPAVSSGVSQRQYILSNSY